MSGAERSPATPRTEAGRLDKRRMPRDMDWYRRESDDELLTGYLLSPAEVVRIQDAARRAGIEEGRIERHVLTANQAHDLIQSGYDQGRSEGRAALAGELRAKLHAMPYEGDVVEAFRREVVILIDASQGGAGPAQPGTGAGAMPSAVSNPALLAAPQADEPGGGE